MSTVRSSLAWVLRALAFLVGAILYVAGIVAYFNNFGGIFKLAGFIPGTFLLLPIVGKGTIGGAPVQAYYWWFWGGVLIVSYYLSAWLKPEFVLRDYARERETPPECAWSRMERVAGKGVAAREVPLVRRSCARTTRRAHRVAHRSLSSHTER